MSKLGIFDLDELQRKPKANIKQRKGIEIKFHGTKIKKVPVKPILSRRKYSPEEGEIIEDEVSLEETEKIIPEKKLVTIRDGRKDSDIERRLVMDSFAKRNIFSVRTKKLESQMEMGHQNELMETIQEPSAVDLGKITKDSLEISLMQKSPKEGSKELVEIEQVEKSDKMELPKKSRKVSKPKDEVEEEDDRDEEEGVEEEDDDRDDVEGVEEEEGVEPKKVKIIRKKKGKPEKVVAEADIQKGNLMGEAVTALLPKPVVAHRVRTSPYYMENRKMYIQKLGPMFSKYKKLLNDETRKASCDSQDSGSKNSAFKLLIHQEVVRDYLNLYTPYRGLLLYHGLGSGKTCSSIAIAEGMKAHKKVFVMTLASLKANFFEQMKVCGDPIYKLNQYWEFVSTKGQPDVVALLSRALNLNTAFINGNEGAWMVNVKKESNFDDLADVDKKAINEQLDEMIASKYAHLSYNGLNLGIMERITEKFTINPFDDAVVVIDEMHNFVSRIVNKIKDKKKKSISYRLYEYLMSAENVRVVVLSGTPIINYPNEIGVLFNILRGYIKTWNFPIQLSKGSEKPTRDNILSWFQNDELHTYDYVQYSGDQITITRNPMGFVNTHKNVKYPKKRGGFIPKSPKKSRKTGGYNPKNKSRKVQTGGGVFNDYSGVELDETGNVTDAAFKASVKRILDRKGLRMSGNITMKNNLALPETSKEFFSLFVGLDEKEMKNKSVFQKRILGLSSYFRGADETLYPQFVPSDDGEIIHIENVPMSEYQFGVYEKIREEESKQEKRNELARRKKELRGDNAEDMFKVSSTYKIASRMACNFVFPNPPGRPVKEKGDVDDADAEREDFEEDEIQKVGLRGKKRVGGDSSEEKEASSDEDAVGDDEDAVEEKETSNDEEDVGDDEDAVEEKEASDEEEEPSRERSPIEYTGNYNKDIQLALMELKMNAKKYLSPEGLRIYSPKFLKILENVNNPDHEGLHMIYSQFRTMEGIGILKLVLEANGYVEFKIRKKGSEGDWEIDENEADKDKPKFALHTGTESAEEKQVILNVYNSKWKEVPHTIMTQIRKRDIENNKMGDVIKIIMITASGAEGINLKNTRYVHLTEPYWHNVRIEQVIGRARRICSHQDLPEDMRTVQVFLYMAVLSEGHGSDQKHIQLRLRDVSKLTNRLANASNDNTRLGRYVRKLELNPGVITTDQMLFEGAIRKEFVNTQILHAVKESAMDCQLYAGSNKDEQIVCYNYGQVKSNAFGSYPSLEQDVAEKDVVDVKETTVKLVRIIDPLTKRDYALNPVSKDLYNYDQWLRSKESMEELFAVGKLRVGKDGKEVVKLF